jgi:hypothetical protein
MRLGLIKKIQQLAKKAWTSARTDSSSPSESNKPKTKTSQIEHTAVVVKTRKRSVQIQCWNCSHLVWVMKGSQCHKTGLCGHCIGSFDQDSGAVKR